MREGNRQNGAQTLAGRLTAEGLGSAFLLAAVVGSGIMGEQLAQGNAAIALLANAAATGAALIALILCFGPVSGGHFNPLVSLAEAARVQLPWRDVLPYIAVQIAGAFAGVASAHLMFDKPVFFASGHVRAGPPMLWSEGVATFGLLCVILMTPKSRPTAVAVAVGCYIAAAYWFTASTSFANPAVTLARAYSDTFAGIRLENVPGFVMAQAAGATAAWLVCRWLSRDGRPDPGPPGRHRE